LDFPAFEFFANRLKESALNLCETHVLTRNSARSLLPYVAATCTAQTNDTSWIEPLGLKLISPKEISLSTPQTRLKANGKCFFDKTSGLKVSVIESANEVILAFGAMGSYKSEVDQAEGKMLQVCQVVLIALNLFGFNIDFYEDAARFVAHFVKCEAFRAKKIVLVGQSLGGSIAQYASLKNRLPAYCFNPVPLGAAQIEKLAKGKIDHRLVKVISTQGDFVPAIADNAVSRFFRKFFNVPTLFGKKYAIPSAFANVIDNHKYFTHSFTKYIGYDVLTALRQ
jgi:hypothetical protein